MSSFGICPALADRRRSDDVSPGRPRGGFLLARCRGSRLADGGWGVDALENLGFGVAHDEFPTRFEVRDAADRRVDFHTVTFDATGGATQQLQDGSFAPYPREGFSGAGRMDGVQFPCLTAAVHALHHLGYDPDEKDHHDMR